MTDKPSTYLQAQLTARSKLLVQARETLINIKDEIEDEGDRVFFGSTNDADRFMALVDEIDGWVWDDIISDADARDYIGELRTMSNAYDIVAAGEKEAREERDNLAALMRRLIYRHGKGLPLDESLTAAADYLSRQNLNGSILRDDSPSGADGRGHNEGDEK